MLTYYIRSVNMQVHKIGGIDLKKYKKLSLLLVVLIFAGLFTGCSQEDKELVNAFIKNQEILSQDSTSDIEFNLSAEGLDEEAQMIFDGIANQINNMKLSLNQKSVTNEEQTVAKAQIDANVLLNDMNFDSSIWVDLDMSSDELVLKEIFKLPSMLINFLPGAVGKEYIVLDFKTMNEAMADIEDISEQVNLDATMEIAMKYQSKFIDAIVDYIKNYNFAHPVVTKLEEKENVKYYEVAFDNDSFKEFLKYTIISILQDESIIPLFEEYMAELMDMAGDEMPKELSFAEKSAEMIEKVEELFEILEELTVLGEDGIRITFGINEDGYFVSEEGKIDLLIDTKQFMNLMAEPMDSTLAPVFKLSIAYDSKINNINENVEITMPATTEENSIDYMELINTMIAADVQQAAEIEAELID